eukprot:1776192-Rhodomonas_salina.2
MLDVSTDAAQQMPVLGGEMLPARDSPAAVQRRPIQQHAIAAGSATRFVSTGQGMRRAWPDTRAADCTVTLSARPPQST